MNPEDEFRIASEKAACYTFVPTSDASAIEAKLLRAGFVRGAFWANAQLVKEHAVEIRKLRTQHAKAMRVRRREIKEENK